MKKLRNPYNTRLCLPRMSWHPFNLYNLHRRSLGPLAAETRFTRSSKTLFQQWWMAKKLVRGYHGDWIQEQRFQRHLLPDMLPPLIASKQDKNEALRRGKVAGDVGRPQRNIPIGSLMFALLERRLDVLIFRACFASSAYAARQLVIHGKVKVDGLRATDPNAQLKPGQVFQVMPSAIQMLREKAAVPKKTSTIKESTEESETTISESENPEAKIETADPQEAAEDVHESNALSAITERNADLPFHLPDFAAPFIFIPPYLEVSFPTCSAVYVRAPTARPGYSEIPTPYDADGEVIRLAWEWYQRVGRRRKSRAEGRPGNNFKHYKDNKHIETTPPTKEEERARRKKLRIARDVEREARMASLGRPAP